MEPPQPQFLLNLHEISANKMDIAFYNSLVKAKRWVITCMLFYFIGIIMSIVTFVVLPSDFPDLYDYLWPLYLLNILVCVEYLFFGFLQYKYVLNNIPLMIGIASQINHVVQDDDVGSIPYVSNSIYNAGTNTSLTDIEYTPEFRRITEKTIGNLLQTVLKIALPNIHGAMRCTFLMSLAFVIYGIVILATWDFTLS